MAYKLLERAKRISEEMEKQKITQKSATSNEVTKIKTGLIPAFKQLYYNQFNALLRQLDALYPELSDEQHQSLRWTEDLLCNWEEGDTVGKEKLETALERIKQRWTTTNKA